MAQKRRSSRRRSQSLRIPETLVTLTIVAAVAWIVTLIIPLPSIVYTIINILWLVIVVWWIIVLVRRFV